MVSFRPIPAIRVKNKVLWKSRHELPFKVKVGGSAAVYFATPAPSPAESHGVLEGLFQHGRSATFGKAWFKGPGGLYRDIDLKGIGHISVGHEPPVKHISPLAQAAAPGTLGLLDRSDAELERNMAHKFLKVGIRTALPIAIVELHEIVDESGHRISIEEARSRGMLHAETKQPVVLVRAFLKKERISNLLDVKGREMRAMIDDAKAVLKREQKKSRSMTDKEYIKWFAQNLGQQIALMHNKGFVHGYLSEHNITLDGRIVDLDSVEKVSKELRTPGEQYAVRRDYDCAKDALDLFWICLPRPLGLTHSSEELHKVFADSYRGTRRPDMQWIVQHE